MSINVSLCSLPVVLKNRSQSPLLRKKILKRQQAVKKKKEKKEKKKEKAKWKREA